MDADDPAQPAAARRVDAWLPAQWPPEVVARLHDWQQGSLLAGTAMMWAAPEGEDLVTGEHGAEDWEAISPGPGGGWSIVVTQTCDVGATGPGAKHPFVQVSPLVNLDGESSEFVSQVDGLHVTYLTPVANVPEPGTWAADLRISIPVSKGLLVTRSPVHGFPSEAAALAFAEHVAGRTRRPAVSDAVVDAVSEILDDVIKTGPKSQDPCWFEDVEQVRVELRPDRLHPTWARVHVLCERKLDASEKKLWRNAAARIKKALGRAGIKGAALGFHEVDQLKAVQYRDWVPIHVSRLNRPRYW